MTPWPGPRIVFLTQKNGTVCMKLIGRFGSPYARRVAVTMQTYGIPYEHVAVNPFGEEKAKVREHNPLGRVPALVLDSGETIVESATIIDFLDELAGPDKALTPRSGEARRAVLKRVSVASGAMDKLVSALYEHHLRPAEFTYRPWAKACDRQVRDGFQWLDAQLAGRDWFVGNRFSQADLTVAVFWQFGCGKRPNFFERMECRNLTVLSGRLAATPAFRNCPEGPGLPKGIALG